jgi:uncharacterized protein YyaL (SSP411 family)
MPSFRRILLAISEAYANKPDDVARTAASIREMYGVQIEPTRSAGPLTTELLDRVYRALADQYDPENGGFGGAPKFPQTMALDFLLRYAARSGVEHAREIVSHSFVRMARGGIYDQVGGGFARYAVDAIWLVPHFEKMLYDNALLIRLGAHLWQATKDDEVRRVTGETIDWALREMRSPDAGFYSSLDADSEGHEGKFYVWRAEELDRVLGDESPMLRAYWGVTPDGNFEGRNIPYVAASDRRAFARRFGVTEQQLDDVVQRAKQTLYAERTRRVWPGRDDKILASWNGLMVRGIAEAARAFGNEKFGDAALRSAEFLFDTLVKDGRVLRSYKDERARIAGYLEDYASLGLAALSVYELTFDPRWLEHARALGDATVHWFWDHETGAFYDTASDHETLITRPRDITDNATPSGTSLAVELLVRLAELLQDVDALRRATYVVETLAPALTRYPTAFGHLLGTADMLINGATELAIVGEPGANEFRALARVAAERYIPSLVLAGGRPTNDIPILEGREARDGRATAYLCRNYTCDEPATSPAMLDEQIASLRR